MDDMKARLFAPLRFHESKPIQVADIVAGAVKTKIQKDEPLDPSTLQG